MIFNSMYSWKEKFLFFFRIRYTLAAEMGDIHMGDTHLIALDDCASEENDTPFDQYVALVVAQHRNHFDFHALDSGMLNYPIQ